MNATTLVTDLRQHITILGWLYIVGHALFLVIGIFVFILLTGLGAITNDPQATWILTTVGTVVGLLMTALALPGILAGYGLLRRRSWGRMLAIVIAVLSLLNFPLGTLIGIYALWVLLQQDASRYFTSYIAA